MTRNNFTCNACPSSPISSRNSVPPVADSKSPILVPTAPVKAPFSYPNISDSSKVSGNAPQLTGMNGLSRRGPFVWIARAMSSLPVPLSPWSRTVLLLSATRATNLYTSNIAVLLPTNGDHASLLFNSSRNRAFS